MYPYWLDDILYYEEDEVAGYLDEEDLMVLGIMSATEEDENDEID